MLADRVRAAGSGGGVIDLSLVDSAGDSGNQTTYTFTDRALGDAAADRTIVVGFHAEGSTGRTISSLDIASGTETIIGTLQESNGIYCAMYRADIASGTTGTITITWSGSMNRCAITVYRLSGHSASAPAASNATTNASSALSFTLSPTVGNATIGVATSNQDGIWNGVSWTELTEDHDSRVESSMVYSGASENPDDGGTNPTCNSSDSGMDMAGVVATWT